MNDLPLQYHTDDDRNCLDELLSKLSGKAEVFFGRTSEQHASTDHGCIIEASGNGLFSYTLEGHCIGSIAQPEASAEETAIRVFEDSLRFSVGKVVATKLTAQQCDGEELP